MLNRLYARISIVLETIALVILLVSYFFFQDWTIRQICLWTAWSMIVSSLIIRFKFFKCPHCGKGDAIPQWSKNGNKSCRKCGESFNYDK